MQGDKGTYPSAGNYTYREVLTKANQTFEIDLCPSQLQQVGEAVLPPILGSIARVACGHPLMALCRAFLESRA